MALGKIIVANQLPVQLESSVCLTDAGPGEFELETGVGTITVRGHMSMGSRGWRLRAGATRRRSVVTIHVTAIETALERHPDLEQHEYTATVRVARAGRYSIRVAHSFLLRDVGGLGMPRPVFEENASVP